MFSPVIETHIRNVSEVIFSLLKITNAEVSRVELQLLRNKVTFRKTYKKICVQIHYNVHRMRKYTQIYERKVEYVMVFISQNNLECVEILHLTRITNLFRIEKHNNL